MPILPRRVTAAAAAALLLAACDAPPTNVITVDVALQQAPGTPTAGVTATPAPYSILLRWADNATNNTDYRIVWSSSAGQQGAFTAGPNATELAFGPVDPGITYTFTVYARQARTFTEHVNSVAVQVAAAAYAEVPSGPYGGTTAYDASRHAVRITWRHDNPASATQWTIERKEHGSAQEWELVHSTTVLPQSGYLDALPQDAQGHSWLYRIRACNPSGCSGPNEISLWTPPYAG